MNDLSVEERDLLQRIQADKALETLFFRKVKGLKWFDSLSDAGYFEAKNIPPPVAAKEEGYVNVPRWGAIQYLVETAPELTDEECEEYAPRFLQIMTDATNYARENHFGSYHVWWQFSKIITIIPPRFITLAHISLADYWLDYIYETGLVAAELGEKWLVKLIGDESNSHSLSLAVPLIGALYKINYVERDSELGKYDAFLRFNPHYAQKITEKTANAAGKRIGRQAVNVYQSRLEELLQRRGNDRWSSIWQPAIEDHDQNKYHDNAENLILKACRECLGGYFECQQSEASKYTALLLNSEFQVIQRIAIHIFTQHYEVPNNYTDIILDKNFLHSNYQHELWRFIHLCYEDFNQAQRDTTLNLISEQSRQDKDGQVLAAATAYEQASWLKAIKDFGIRENRAYLDAVAVSGSSPKHPSFSSYMSSGWHSPKSTYQIDKLASLDIPALVGKLVDFEETEGWDEPSLEGLTNVVKRLFEEYPVLFIRISLSLKYSIFLT